MSARRNVRVPPRRTSPNRSQGDPVWRQHVEQIARRLWERVRLRLHGYADNHGHALFSSLGRLWRTPLATTLTILVIAISMALPASFYVVLKNAQQLGATLDHSGQISLFLKPTLDDDIAVHLADQLKEHPNTDTVTLITRAGALQEFRTYSGFAEAVDALGSNPLPAMLQVAPKDSSALETWAAELRRLPEVDYVQLDTQWSERLHALLHLANHTISLIAGLLSLAVLLVVGNTIRLDLENRKEEIIIAKLVGATHSFISRPFLYCGFWYGFLGALLAWLLVTLLTLSAYPSVNRLSELYMRELDLRFLGFFDTLLMLSGGSVLAMLGTWAVLQPHLRHMNPE